MPNVLITAGSRRVALVEGFRRALRDTGLGGRVVVADVNALSPSVHLADAAYRVPLSSEPRYLDDVAGICDAERIDLLVPTIDEELPVFARARGRFAAAGVRVLVSNPSTATLCNDKLETCRRLRALGIPAAETFLPGLVPPRVAFPLFVKPRRGRGSVGAFPVHTPRELEFFTSYVQEPIVQPYLAAPEFTIDMLCDFAGVPLSIVPRERTVIRAGVTDRGRTVRDERLIGLAMACAEALPFVGPVNIQCRMDGGRPAIFEINPRFSGGIPLTMAAGGDFPRMIVELTVGRDVAPRVGDYTADLWMTNFESSLFLDSGDLDALRARPVAVPMVQCQ